MVLLEHSIICKKCNKFEHLVQQHVLGVMGNVVRCFVGNLTDFPGVKEFKKLSEICLKNIATIVCAFYSETQCIKCRRRNIVWLYWLNALFDVKNWWSILVTMNFNMCTQVTGKMRGGHNPFTLGCMVNCKYTLCGPSWPVYVFSVFVFCDS